MYKLNSQTASIICNDGNKLSFPAVDMKVRKTSKKNNLSKIAIVLIDIMIAIIVLMEVATIAFIGWYCQFNSIIFYIPASIISVLFVLFLNQIMQPRTLTLEISKSSALVKVDNQDIILK